MARGPHPSHWVVSPAVDFGWFVAPGLIAAALGLALVGSEASEGRGELATWIIGVLLVDVAHVYASTFRTYFDREAMQRHRTLLVVAPLVVFVCGFGLHSWSPVAFWSVLAYIAIFHFIKQHEGFVSIYARGGVESPVDTRLAKLAVWAGTCGPVVWWHAHLPRSFAWFMPGDLVSGLPPLAGDLALVFEGLILAAFVVRRSVLVFDGRPNWMVPALVLTPALCWNLGIVWTNDDRVFTVTNVFLHGIPYLALVWITGGRAKVQSWISRDLDGQMPAAIPVIALAAIYYGVVVALAVGEETAWDRLFWHDHEDLFGVGRSQLDQTAAAAAAALLTVPQATHYVLDRYIWRAGPKNPELAQQLGLPTKVPEPRPRTT